MRKKNDEQIFLEGIREPAHFIPYKEDLINYLSFYGVEELKEIQCAVAKELKKKDGKKN